MRRVLFCGFGWAARTLWAPALARGGFDEAGIVDEHASLDGIGLPVRRHEDVHAVAADDYDIVVVASPNATHAEIAAGLLDRGFPVVVEKPVCTSQAEFERLRAAAERGGGLLLRSCSTRYDPHLALLAGCLEKEGLGRPESISISWTRRNGVPNSQWVTTARHAVAGSSIDLGWHLLEIAMSIVGYFPYTVERAAFVGHSMAHPSSRALWHGFAEGDSTIDVDVAARIDLRSQSAAPLALQTAWAAERHGDAVEVEVIGDGVRIRLTTILGVSPAGPDTPMIEVDRAGKLKRIPLDPKPRGAAHAAMVADFVHRGFDPVGLGQSWPQLSALALTSEAIVGAHRLWRSPESKEGL